ncbi:uncharacterized protein Z520_02422 [Fonsecaea multimorphosa CBS 102226]|uniref:Non-homologous end-joining factor 1 n=1 Tax=Fonsecaea multimorphosa CBS 102226 TaxID=1442371 RepID=A0A0D2KZW3_9EURO|nr:uncharacterized protein Z520_02422 [Fonsecaea multimorphosa CBS 102226]KIY02284.1 hypothetical protein Z520_02422 [Fonsecaea multimorphosa CBS 102226]OAL28931.1 hypothetical protein AYO22_02367 [Fonsecaea multimorphosa]
MPDSASEGWQELQTAPRRSCPKLFYSLSTTKEQSLTLLLTDLISIWESSLDRYDILAAAARQQTSIDPSVSSDQFEVLLSKIRKSLRDGENHIVRDGGHGGSSQAQLLLRTRIDLPRPLRPLEWTFTLDPQRASELAERILRPSLHEVFVSQKKITSLLGIIREKDHIISRLLDRVGNSAVDLSLVFPGITGFISRKGGGGNVSVADAKKHVPGMASFDEKSWTRQFANDDDGYEGADRTGLSNLVRGCEKCFAHSRAEHESWVKDLPSTEKLDQNEASKQRIGSPSTKAVQKKPDIDRDSTDDEFERQATPPHLKSKDTEKTSHETTRDEETGEDEPIPKRAGPSTIGGIGRRKATKAFGASRRSPDPASVANSQSLSRRRTSTASTETASEDEDVADEAPQPPSVAPQNKSDHHPAQKSKLAALRSRKVSSSPSLSPPPPPQSRSSTSSAERVSNKGPPSRNLRVAARVSKTPEAEEEEEGEENDDLNGTSSTPTPSPSPSPPPASAKSSTPAHEKRRLGRLGGKKQATPSRSTTTSPSPREKTSNGKRDEKIPETQTPTKRRLGRLGAGLRKKERETTTSPNIAQDKHPSPMEEDEKEDGDDSAGTNTPSLRSASASRSSSRRKAADAEQRRRQHHSPPPPPPPPSTRTKPVGEQPQRKKEETAEEAASRRRMELKRTIEAKDGGRKKRRF